MAFVRRFTIANTPASLNQVLRLIYLLGTS